MEGEDQDKSEQATPHKLRKAREQGSVARGTDLGFVGVLLALIGFMWAQGDALQASIAEATRVAFVGGPTLLASPNELIAAMGQILGGVLLPLSWLLLIAFGVVLALEFLQTGPVFSVAPLKPDWGRLNPAKGLKRVFSVRMLVETAKATFKVALYAAIVWFLVREAIAIAPAIVDGASLAEQSEHLGLKLVGFFILAALAFAAVDQLVSRRDFAKRMRMSRRDVRREHKDREGDARLKQRRRQLHGEFAKQGDSLRNVKGADLLITNPTHYAVALKYDPAKMDAPLVVSRGAHGLAGQLRRLAFIHGVPIFQDPELARALYALGDINRKVPADRFQAVADLYLKLRRSKRETDEARRAA